ncbi:MAG: formylglycine-generating enzyme family protein, partial [Dolichospermum sp.]
IPGGTFMMGSPENEEGSINSERPQHEVTIKPFLMGKYPVTQKQWRAVAALEKVNVDLEADPSYFEADPSYFEDNNLPVEHISWHEAVEFCARLSRMANKTYRLPTEAEWEYACRAGTTTPFYCGDKITTKLANYDRSYTYNDEQEGTTEVGSFPPNLFGLYDMHGNVWEWCQDTWHDNYEGAPIDGSAWISLTNRKVLRGGSWNYYPVLCRSASRNWDNAKFNYDNFGFRVVCDA